MRVSRPIFRVVLCTFAPLVGAASIASGQQIDVCALLPKDEVAKITARTDLGRVRSEQLPEGAVGCRYAGRVQGGITITVAPNATRGDFDAYKKLLTDAGTPPESLNGVGDVAYFSDASRVYALSGKYGVTVAISPTPGAEAKIRTDAIALAQAVIAKLKR